jgi:hypothetical protein
LEDQPGNWTENLLAGSVVPLTVSSYGVTLDPNTQICADGTSVCQMATIALWLQDPNNAQNSMSFTTTLEQRDH